MAETKSNRGAHNRPDLKMKGVAGPVPPIEDDKKEHSCRPLMDSNRIRSLNGESNVFIFEDFDSCQMNMKIGLEFVVVKHCPFCGEKLC